MSPLPPDEDDKQDDGGDKRCANAQITKPVFLLPAVERELENRNAEAYKAEPMKSTSRCFEAFCVRPDGVISTMRLERKKIECPPAD